MILEKASGGNREQSGKAKLSYKDKVQEVSPILGNQSMLQMEKISGESAGVVLQRWERDAGNYGNTTLYGIGTGNPPEVSRSQYVGTAGGGQNFVLGWNSMVVFTGQDGAFQIGNVVSDDPRYPAPAGPGQAVEAVVTRGVASCTAVLVSDGDEAAFLHLDHSRLPWGLEQLRAIDAQWRTQRPDGGGIRNIFISYTDDRSGHGDAFNFANRDIPGVFPLAQVSRLNRGTVDQSNAIHSEIGLGYTDDGQQEVFGDMLSPDFTQLIRRNFRVALNEMSTDLEDPGFNRFLFHQPYPNPHIEPPAIWANLVPADGIPHPPGPQQPARPGLFRRFINWIKQSFNC